MIKIFKTILSWFTKPLSYTCLSDHQPSQGESKIEAWLTTNNIEFVSEVIFKGCQNKKMIGLPFDFYLPAMKTCIEYDGRQHRKVSNLDIRSMGMVGAIRKLERKKINDETKNEFCLTNDIRLIRISYKKFRKIDKVLAIELGA
jgi:very-short-patch-repair endonuclease